MEGIKEILSKYIEIKRIGKHGKFVILNTNIATLEKELNKRSEQFVCVTCGSKPMCKSCLRIPKEWLKQ